MNKMKLLANYCLHLCFDVPILNVPNNLQKQEGLKFSTCLYAIDLSPDEQSRHQFITERINLFGICG